MLWEKEIKIFLLEREVDGCGRMSNMYFSTFDLAKKYALGRTPAIYAYDGKYYIEGMKDCKVREYDNEYLTIIGITHTKMTEESLKYFSIHISPRLLPFDIIDDKIFELRHIKGYKSWLFVSGDFDSYEQYKRCNPPTVLQYYPTREIAEKEAEKDPQYHNYNKGWLESDFEKISSIGGGEDYIDIHQYDLHTA